MANSYLTPNMSLIVPVPGSQMGPDWANNLNSSLTILDQHSHVGGSGVQITPSAININTTLQMNGFGLNLSGPIVMSTQGSTPGNLSLYSTNPDLFFVDGNGNNVQITSGGLVNATSSGISSGTASASFVAGVLVVNAASTTPANIQGASLLMGNNSAGSHYLTLTPPAAMGANFALVLPALPVSTQILALDTSGNITAPTSLSTTGSLTVGTLASTGSFTAGATTIAGGLSIDTLTASGTITATGAAALNGGTSTTTLAVSSTSSFTGTLTAGNLSIATMTASGTVNLNGTANINGAVISSTNSTIGGRKPVCAAFGPIASPLGIVRGNVTIAAGVGNGEGFTAVANGAGGYTVTFSNGSFTATPVVVLTSTGQNISFSITATSSTAFTCVASNGANNPFNFIAIGL